MGNFCASLAPSRVVGQRPAAQEQQGLYAWPALRLGLGYRLEDAPPVLAFLQDHPAPSHPLAATRCLSYRLGATRPAVRAAPRDQLGSDSPGRLQEAVKKRGEETGPSPVDRAKCGTAVHVACDARAMPLGVVVTKANANDGCQTEAVLQAMVRQPPLPDVAVQQPDPRALPRAQADGAMPFNMGPSLAKVSARWSDHR